MPRKIRFWRTFGDSFAFVFADWGRFFRLSGAWIAVGTLLYVLVLALLGLGAFGSAPRGHLPSGDQLTALLIFVVFAVIAYIAFAVAWHRAVLLDETREPLRALRFRGRELRFLGYSIAIVLLWLVVFTVAISIIAFGAIFAAAGTLAIGTVSKTAGPVYAVVVLAIVVGIVAALPFFARLTLGLPAIAVGESPGVLGRAWHRGWRNGWRLFWGPFLCSLPLSIVSGIFSAGQRLMEYVAGFGDAWRVIGMASMIVLYVLASITHFLAVATAIAFLSLSYRQLSGDGTRTLSAPAPEYDPPLET
jgi:hypothetical protein